MAPPAIDVRAAADADDAARQAAAFIAQRLRAAASVRANVTLAMSGGRTALPMLRLLAAEPLPWEQTHVVQVDERVAPPAHPERNAAAARAAFAGPLAAHPGNFHWMPVEGPDLAVGALDYARVLAAVAGTPPVLDVVHLGLGDDGHTASIFPGAPLLTGDVAVTEAERGWRRMTLTLPVLNRARCLVWLVVGRDKQAPLARLLRADPTVVASRVRREDAIVFTDAEAVSREPTSAPAPLNS
jgi:6-phosphogluconolactonase